MSIALLMMIKDEFKAVKNIINAVSDVCEEKIIVFFSSLEFLISSIIALEVITSRPVVGSSNTIISGS